MFGLCSHIRRVRLKAALHRMVSVRHQSTARAIRADETYVFEWLSRRAVRYGQKIYITIFWFFFPISILITILTQTDMLYLTHLVFAHLTCFCTCFCTSYLSCTSCFALFFILLHILLFISFFYLYIYIYALVWCYFYIIFILCTVHWADLIWSTFHFWLYPV